MKLYSGPLSMFGAKAEIAALEKGIDCQREFVPFSLATLYEPKHPAVARVNPKQQVPVLVDGDLEIFDSTQIFEYFEHLKPEPPLWPADPKQRARARLLELKSDEVFFPNVIVLMPQRSSADAATRAQATAAIRAYYDEMETTLDGKDYLAGTFSYADIASYMAQSFAEMLSAPLAKEHVHLHVWKTRLGERASIRRVVGAMREYLHAQGVPVAAAS
jgi:glutathione S-transferase